MAKGTEIKFISLSAEAKYTLVGLSKTALREDGKLIRKILRDSVPKRYNRLRNHVASWARIDDKTGQPILEIGFYSWQKVKSRGKKPSHANPHWVEFGTSPHSIQIENAKAMGYGNNFYGTKISHPGQRGTNVLRNAVYDNIDAIRDLQSEFLAYLNDTLEAAGAKIVESEEAEDD